MKYVTARLASRKKMKDDMMECANRISYEDEHPFTRVKDCNGCSWDNIKFKSEDFCTLPEVRKAVLINERNVTYYGEQ